MKTWMKATLAVSVLTALGLAFAKKKEEPAKAKPKAPTPTPPSPTPPPAPTPPPPEDPSEDPGVKAAADEEQAENERIMAAIEGDLKSLEMRASSMEKHLNKVAADIINLAGVTVQEYSRGGVFIQLANADVVRPLLTVWEAFLTQVDDEIKGNTALYQQMFTDSLTAANFYALKEDAKRKRDALGLAVQFHDRGGKASGQSEAEAIDKINTLLA